jgi:hypothetical protein
LVTGLWLGATGCKNSSGASVAPDPAALKAQQELMARRDSLLAEREKLQKEGEKLTEEIKAVEATGGDTTELAKKKADIEQQMKGQDLELEKVRSNVEATLAKIQAAGDAAAGMAVREATVGSRERGLTTREERVADRERQIAARDAALALREKETCGAGGGTTTIIQQVAPPKAGGNYSRNEVEAVLGRAKSNMQRKGISTADLPPGAQGLERDALKAINEKDMGKAYFAAAQLSTNVDAVKIDRAFVKAKYDRLNARVRSAKVDAATQKQLTEGMGDILQKWGDGNFAAANQRLNALALLVR